MVGRLTPTTLILTLTDNGAATPDVTVDLSSLQSTVTNNADGTYTHDSGNGTTTNIVTTSADAGIQSVGSDNGTVVTAAAVAGVLQDWRRNTACT